MGKSLLGKVLISTFLLAIKSESNFEISFKEYDYPSILLITAIQLELAELNKARTKRFVKEQLKNASYNPKKLIFEQDWFAEDQADVILSNIIDIVVDIPPPIDDNNSSDITMSSSDDNTSDSIENSSDDEIASDDDCKDFFRKNASGILKDWENQLLS